MASQLKRSAEWIETDGLGGFASGTVAGVRTRRYHGLLLTAKRPPTERVMLVNGFDAWVEIEGRATSLTTQFYVPGVIPPDQGLEPTCFESEPWPRWTYQLPGGPRVEFELFIPHEQPLVALRWRLVTPRAGVTLHVRPFFSGRDYHALHRENAALRFEPAAVQDRLVWRLYDGVPAVSLVSNGVYTHQPTWYRQFLYEQERLRGLDCVEDLAAPGVLQFDLSGGDAVCLLAAGEEALPAGGPMAAQRLMKTLREGERVRRAKFASPRLRAADQYFVRRGAGRTTVAGYPWFTDWGRDTFIAMRGLCLATGRLEDACDILLEWASAVSEGMLPNRFPDAGEAPEYNAVDASLWYVLVVHEFLAAAREARFALPAAHVGTLRTAVRAILEGYARGTRYGIRADRDGLLSAGVPGVQLTWMDAKVGDWVVTPRIGKPVEVQALWLNALHAAAGEDPRWAALLEKGRASFAERFWNESAGCLFDVVDRDHQRGANDASLRPNQIFAAGGLPLPLLDEDRARRVVDAVERTLWTPAGLRSLAPSDPYYRGRYAGGVLERDGAYHQGTVWPWLIGPFVEAWVRVRGGTPQAAREARERFLRPLGEALASAASAHLPEVADGDAPHASGGCPFQAWSLAESLRIEKHLDGILGGAASRDAGGARPRRVLAAPRPAR